MRTPPIFVDIPVRASLADLWDKTQDPAAHVRWDLRFTTIRYLPRPNPEEPQRFAYEMRLGFGIRITGYGETVGRSEAGTSALKFGSEDPLSLISEGTGCWVYRRQGEGVLFRTVYNYDVRHGRAGRLLDRWLFRPLMAWATAWSFDRLRIWVEHGIRPEVSRTAAVAQAAVRAAMAVLLLRSIVQPHALLALLPLAAVERLLSRYSPSARRCNYGLEGTR